MRPQFAAARRVRHRPASAERPIRLSMPVQLRGGYGYMNEYRMAQEYVGTRVVPIFADSNEITKEFIGRNLGV